VIVMLRDAATEEVRMVNPPVNVFPGGPSGRLYCCQYLL
jgi:hypothetical protein